MSDGRGIKPEVLPYLICLRYGEMFYQRQRSTTDNYVIIDGGPVVDTLIHESHHIYFLLIATAHVALVRSLAKQELKSNCDLCSCRNTRGCSKDLALLMSLAVCAGFGNTASGNLQSRFYIRLVFVRSFLLGIAIVTYLKT